MTYKELYTSLLDYADKTALSTLPQAKRAINDAIRWCNRKHNFKMAEGVVNVTYPAGEFFMDLNISCDQAVLNPITVQQVTADITTTGTVLPIYDYARIQALRWKRYSKSTPDYRLTPSDVGYVSDECPEDYKVFILGKGFGLYPTPTEDVPLFIHFNERLRDLSDDTDTNFLTDFCHDFLLTKALMSTFMLYLPKERLETLAKDVLLADWESVVHWDKQLRNSENWFDSV